MSCAGSPAPRATPGTEARSTLVRVATPSVPLADALELASDNRAFTLDLHHALGRATAGNLVLSPISISIALAMLYGGAAGGTATELASTLHFELPPERLHPAFDGLDLALTMQPTGGTGIFRLTLTNATWGQTGHAFLPGYLDLLAANYGAGIRLVDFARAAEIAQATINGWVERARRDRTAGAGGGRQARAATAPFALAPSPRGQDSALTRGQNVLEPHSPGE